MDHKRGLIGVVSNHVEAFAKILETVAFVRVDRAGPLDEQREAEALKQFVKQAAVDYLQADKHAESTPTEP